MKAIILARVSTEEQKEANNSLPAQIERIKAYCVRKGFEVSPDRTFSFDESAYKTKRDEFDKILDYIEAHKGKIAVCFDKVDRLSRNVFDKRVSTLYEKAVADEIELHFVSDGQIINSSMSAVQKFQFGMSLGLAKYYSDAISDNVKRTFEKMRREGVWLGRPRIGYKNALDAKDKRTIVPDPETQHIIVRLFELYATGNYSLETLRLEAIKMGLRGTRSQDEPARSCIENILKDTFYHGIAFSQKHNLHYPHQYAHLISKQLFDKCQEVRERKTTNRPRGLSKEYVFQGLLTCKNCGCSMTPELKIKDSGKSYIYYSCTNSKRNCKRLYTSEKTLLEPVYKVLEQLGKIKQKDQEYLVEKLRQTTEAEVVFHKAQITRIRNEYERLKQKDDNLLEAFLEKSITKDVYDKKHQEYHDKLQLLNIELAEHTKADYDYQTTVATVFSVARRAKEIVESSEPNEKRAFLNYLLQNPTVSGKKLEFTLRTPFNFVFELATSPVRGA